MHLIELLSVQEEAFVINQWHFFDTSDKRWTFEETEKAHVQSSADFLAFAPVVLFAVLLVFNDEFTVNFSNNRSEALRNLDISPNGDILQWFSFIGLYSSIRG